VAERLFAKAPELHRGRRREELVIFRVVFPTAKSLLPADVSRLEDVRRMVETAAAFAAAEVVVNKPQWASREPSSTGCESVAEGAGPT